MVWLGGARVPPPTRNSPGGSSRSGLVGYPLAALTLKPIIITKPLSDKRESDILHDCVSRDILIVQTSPETLETG